MEKKASNYLPLFLILFWVSIPAFALNAFDLELNDAVQKKDWPSVVLLLQPKKGQNFEHDLTLAKALLSLERRQEAQKLLVSLAETRKDERLNRLLQSAGTIFFNQETSNAYYESLELLRGLKFPEAKERLEQGLSKEPFQVLMLTRLIQMNLVLGQRDQAAANLKLAESVTVGLPELKLFGAKLMIDAPVIPVPADDANGALSTGLNNADDEAERTPFLELGPLKNQLLENEVTARFWFEALKRAGKTVDLDSLMQKSLKDHPLWTYLLIWEFQNADKNPDLKTKLDAQIEKNLTNKDTFNHSLDLEMKKSDDLWVGYVNFEALLAQWQALHPKTTPAPTVSAKPKS